MSQPVAVPSLFVRQLKFWSLHCAINSLPSFAIALFFLHLWKQPAAVAAMLAAIGTFVLLYAFVTSLPGPLADPHGAFSRALKLGTKIRMIVSLASLPLLPAGGLFFTPDFWCGWAACLLVNAAGNKWFGSGDLIRLEGSAPAAVYATTMLEGFILSLMLMMISFFALLIGQIRQRRKFQAAVRTPA